MSSHIQTGSKSFTYLGDELVSTPDTFTDIEEEHELQIPTTNSISESNELPIEFYIVGTSGRYISLSQSYIHIRFKVLNKEGRDITATDIVGPINLAAQALFSHSDLYLNEEPVSKSNGQYSQRAYISTVVGHTKEAKESWLQSELYYEDAYGASFDSHIIKANASSGINTGFIERQEYVSQSKVVYTVIKPHIDLFNQSRPIPPNVNIRLRFIRNKAEYCLMSNGLKEFQLQIISAVLYAKSLKVNDSVMLKHKHVLTNNGKMIYPIRRVQMQSFTLPLNIRNHIRPNLITGQLPKRIILCMTTNKAFNGDYTCSPFRYRPFNISKLSLNVNGRSCPSRPYVFNFSNSGIGKEYSRAFRALSSITGPDYVTKGNGISRKMFEDGYTMIPFTINEEYSNDTLSLNHEGSIQLEMEFSIATSEVINVILYIEYENIITIGKQGEVTINY